MGEINPNLGMDMPDSVAVGIQINYNAQAGTRRTARPWTYTLLFPYENRFRLFLSRAGYLSDGAVDYIGGGETFHTPQGAEDHAEIVAKSVVKQYKQWLEAELQSRKYTLVIPLDTGDNNE